MCENCVKKGWGTQITDDVYCMGIDFKCLLFFNEHTGINDICAIVSTKRNVKSLIQDIFHENPPKIQMDWDNPEYLKFDDSMPIFNQERVLLEPYMVENYDEIIEKFSVAIRQLKLLESTRKPVAK